MAFRVALTVTAQLELMELPRPGQEMVGQLFELLGEDRWRDEKKVDSGMFDGEGTAALPVFGAFHERAVAWFVEDEEAGDVVVLHISLLSRFRYP